MKLMDVVGQHAEEVPAAQIRIRKPQRQEVDIRDPHELAMWCRRFGVTPLQLCSVIDRVGTDALTVQSAIRSR